MKKLQNNLCAFKAASYFQELSYYLLKIILLILIVTEPIYGKTGLPIPRFASLKSNQIYVRAGPNVSYPIQWVYVSANEPVEIVAEFEQWRRIRDKYGDGGWVHQSMLSGKRFVVVIGNSSREIYKEQSHKSKIIAKASPELRCQLKKIIDKWCFVDCKGNKGWVQKEYLWGVYLKENM
jgi:SH3-like domain-containing protein